MTRRARAGVLIAIAIATACIPSRPPPTPPPSAPSATPAPASPTDLRSPAAAVAVDPALLELLPDAVAGVPLEPDEATAAEIAREPSIAPFVSALAIAAAFRPQATDTGDDYVVVTVARVKPGLFGALFYRGWRDTFDAAVCEQAGGVDGHAEAEIAEFADAVSADLSRRRGRPVPVAHGTPAAGADQIRESYRQAREALGIGQRMGMSGSVSYHDLRGYGVLELVAETERSRRFVEDVLGSLRPGSDLYDTLVAYLGAGGNVNAAARELDVHRNTMLSKLDRISRAMAMDVRAPENQFTAWLAVRLELLDHLHTAVEREINYL